MTFKRSYEVSVWTLQDEFISILKASNIENKGQIEKPEFHLVDDGTEEFNFSIPMYLYEGKNRIINPLWESVENGIIIQDMRKIKVTYNKNTQYEKTFEFIITELEERHTSDQLYCDVTCSGLAFHELGKIGYKITMNADDINNDDYDYFIGKIYTQPHATLNYWMNKILPYLPKKESEIDPSQWYYKVEMDWSAFSDGRKSDKIYEDSYVKSWNIFEDRYIANEIANAAEKERIPDIKESNIYNITQDLAKLFGVFCRYEYSHDQNLNITKRVVVFYNNYMREKEGYIDLTYPYSTSEITRNRNSNDLSTKMYIRPVDDEMSSSGQITVLNVPANKMKEDYILNFDYLIKLGNISSDQQEAIKEFEVKIGKYNKTLQEIENPLMIAQNELNKIQANITLYTNAIALDKEQISSSNDLLNELTDNTGILEVTNKNPRTAVLLKQKDDEKYYYINLTDKGIIPETIKIYKTYDFTNLGLTNPVEYGKVVYDEFNNVNKIEQITNNEEKNIVYLTYKYKPQLYYDNIRIVWENRLSQDEQNLATAKSRLATIQLQIDHLTNLYQTNLDNKNKTCKAFERLMGPALRESQWQPEDYTDYGHNYIDNFSINYTNNYIQKGKSGLTKFLWDKKPFSDELEKTGYKTGINLDWCGYPVIDLSGHEEYIKKYYDKLSFMFYDFLSDESLDDPTAKTIKNMKIFSTPATAQYGFVNYNGIRPVLILTGFEKLSDNSRKKVSNSKYSPIVGVITTRVEGSSVITSIQPDFWTPIFLNDLGNGKFEAMEVYYPRIEISTLDIKIDDYLLGITYNNQLLKNYEDYYLLIRDNSEWENDILVTSNSAYYATLKPSVIMQYGITGGLINFKFNVSNADVAIYLDAIKILKENSQPKVSYTIQPSVLDQEFLYTLYNRLCRICNINDYELKFENVQGYISSITINCDNPNEDSIEIKNYKSKFEDIFSTIVAQTVSMQKNAYALDVISGAFNSGGIISQNTLQSSIDASDLNFNFNKKGLTIDEERGIQCLSGDGAISIRNSGIFISTKKDTNNDWEWNSAILPRGISADSITAGHIDTNQVKIYAGDRVRFQMNENGLFAYKSFFEDLKHELLDGEYQKITNASTRVNDIDSSQYVVMNENGLFLWGKKDALVLNKEKNGYRDPLTQDVARVEVSWDGFKLRNWSNEEVFYADPDTGDLNITGAIKATSLNIDNNSGNKLSLNSTAGTITLQSDEDSLIELKGDSLKLKGAALDMIGGQITMETIPENGQSDAVSLKLAGNVISMRTINNEGSTENVNISSDGIELKIDDNLSLMIEKDVIHFRKVIQEETQENEQENELEQESENQGERRTEYNDLFSVDKDGTLTCRKLICTGDITGYIPDLTPSEESPSPQPQVQSYTLYYNESDFQRKYGGTPGSTPYISRKTIFRSQIQIPQGNYSAVVDFQFLVTDGKISTQELSIGGIIIDKSPSDNNNKFDFKNNENPFTINIGNNTEILELNTILTYVCAEGNYNLYGTQWSNTYTQKITLTPEST